MQTFKKIIFLLTPKEKKQLSLIFVMITIMAFLDMIGVASILPFVAVLSNPSLVETNTYLNLVFTTSRGFGIETKQNFLIFLGVVVFILLIFSIAFKALTTYAQLRFIQIREYSVGKRLMEVYLHQPYSWYLSQNSAELEKTILSEVAQVIGNAMKPIIELAARSILVIVLLALLVTVSPKVTLIMGLSLGLAYSFIFIFVRKFINKLGEDRLSNNELRFKTVSEALGAVKAVKVGGLENFYLKSFSNSALIYSKTTANVQIISQLPRFILEIILFGGILFLILYNMSLKDNFSNFLPILSLYIFAGYRLMPALQQLYVSFSQLTFIGASLDKLYNELKSLQPLIKYEKQNLLKINKTISLKNIYYNYPNVSRVVLENINLDISANSTVGLIGATGSGKTTLVDIILGLLDPQKGTLQVDGEHITKKNIRSWQRSIGYVPQHIYLADDTIMANIALGVEPKNINQETVEYASKIAKLHQFIVKELPEKYQTKVGERGVKLSGGQCQRIGIARAIYHNPQLLIFDEATSALDSETEQAVMDGIDNLKNHKTIILIAHRFNTLKKCDIIFKLEKGQIVSQGSYDEIINN